MVDGLIEHVLSKTKITSSFPVVIPVAKSLPVQPAACCQATEGSPASDLDEATMESSRNFPPSKPWIQT